MKPLYLLGLIAMVSLSCQQNKPETATLQTEETPHDFMFMQRAYPTGQINTNAYADAVAWRRAQSTRRSGERIWEFAGPINTGGRITDIEIPIDQPQTYYVGAASGGIFKTTDGGQTWLPIFDDQAMLSIGDM